MGNDKICGTCKYCMYRLRKNNEIPNDGYCYANPPQLGMMRIKTKLQDKACRLHAQKTSETESILRSE